MGTRAGALRLAMQTAPYVQDRLGLRSESGIHKSSPSPEVDEGGTHNDAIAQDAEDGFSSAVSSTSPLVENLLHVLEAARFHQMPEEEMASMVEEMQKMVHKPEQLLEVVAELDPEEREQLTDTLVEARVVSEERRGLLAETVRPGGHADKLSLAIWMVDKVCAKAWIFALLPCAELVAAAVFHAEVSPSISERCDSELVAWIRGD